MNDGRELDEFGTGAEHDRDGTHTESEVKDTGRPKRVGRPFKQKITRVPADTVPLPDLTTLAAYRARTEVATRTKKLNVTPERIRESPIRPWMRQYAAWLATRPVTPPMGQRILAASKCAHITVSAAAVKALETRDDFKALVEQMFAEARDAARPELEKAFVPAVKAHAWAIKAAKQQGDYRAMAPLTVPILDRIMPKQEQPQPIAPIIQIALAAGTQQEQLRKAITAATEDVQDADIERIEDA